MSDFKDGDIVFDPQCQESFRYNHHRDQEIRQRLRKGSISDTLNVKDMEEKRGGCWKVRDEFQK